MFLICGCCCYRWFFSHLPTAICLLLSRGIVQQVIVWAMRLQTICAVEIIIDQAIPCTQTHAHIYTYMHVYMAIDVYVCIANLTCLDYVNQWSLWSTHSIIGRRIKWFDLNLIKISRINYNNCNNNNSRNNNNN